MDIAAAIHLGNNAVGSGPNYTEDILNALRTQCFNHSLSGFHPCHELPRGLCAKKLAGQCPGRHNPHRKPARLTAPIAHTGGIRLMKLISFDIDGTLEVGDPPGIITMDMVRFTKTLGYLIGSCSDRPISYQQQLWAQHNIRVDFTVLKHRLADVKAQFQIESYYHIGDTDM